MTRYPACFAHMVGKSVARKRQLLKHIPGVVKCESMLYIGANPRRMELLDLFWAKAPDMRIHVVEAWEENVKGLKKLNAEYGIFRDIIHQDVRNIVEVKGREVHYQDMWDIVMFWHGPEHLEKEEIPSILGAMEILADRYVILGCPWGSFPQKDVGGNPFEEHKSVLYPKDFISWGYWTDTIKKPGKRGGHILAWKELS